MEQNMTVEQVLIETKRLLEGVMLPVGFGEAYEKIRGAIANIQLCIDAHAKVREAKEREAEQDKPESMIKENSDCKSHSD